MWSTCTGSAADEFGKGGARMKRRSLVKEWPLDSLTVILTSWLISSAPHEDFSDLYEKMGEGKVQCSHRACHRN